jgi:hypothetical protein
VSEIFGKTDNFRFLCPQQLCSCETLVAILTERL